MKPVLDDPVPIVVAHRGSRLIWPENTMEAFSWAVGLGVRWLETDLHVTADGVLVCIHDDTVDRTTDGHGPVRSYDLQSLRRLDAGFRHSPGGGLTPFRGRGMVIPALEEVMDAFGDVRMVLDLKEDGVEDALVALILRRNWQDRVVVGSFSDERLARFRALTGGAVATSSGPKETFRLWMWAHRGGPVEAACDALQVPRRFQGLPVVTARTVDRWHELGLAVHVWTVNEPAVMQRLLDIEVDGLISDRPDIALAVAGVGRS